MKSITTIHALAACALWVPLALAEDVLPEPVPAAQPTAVQTLQIGGTISQFGDNTVALRTDTSVAPVQYRYTTTTQWVDETGTVVTRESVQTGAPVTMYYTKTPEGLVISKVVVRKGPGPTVGVAPVAAPATVQQETVTTTTTTGPLETAGTISQFADDHFTIRAADPNANPVQYLFSDTTKWMDESGNIVPREVVRTGVPVTIYYTKSAQGLVTSKVVVRRGSPPPQATVEKVQITETPAPKVIERKAAVIDPAPTEKRKTVAKEKPEPKAAKRKVVEKEEPVVVEKEKPAVVEKKTTVTTTTTPVPKKKKHLFGDDDDKDDDKD